MWSNSCTSGYSSLYSGIILKNIISTSLNTACVSHIFPLHLPSDNTNIWATFPGKLSTSLKHTFNFFSVDTVNNKVILSNAKKVFNESILYEDFFFNGKTDEITFKSNHNYMVENEINDAITTLQQGMFELFETISNIPAYQKGIIAMNYLLKKAFGTPGDFLTNLFTIEAFDSMMNDPERLKSTLLQSIDPIKQEIVLNHATYGILHQSGLVNWIKIVGNDKLIAEATWLTTFLGLNEKDISLLVGKNSFLNQYFTIFNNKLVTIYNCPNNPCQYEIIYHQLFDQSVTKYVGIDNLKELHNQIDPKSYPFDSSPEILYYYNTMKDQTIPYETLQISLMQLKIFFEEKSDKTLFNPVNAINILNYNITEDLYSSYSDFIINSRDQLTFVTNYFFDFLPKNFLFGSIKNNDKTYNIEPLAKGYLSLLQELIDRTYGALINNEFMYATVLAKMVQIQLDPALLEETCPMILQKIINDGRKVLKICAMDDFSMKSVKGLRGWMQVYICITTTCNKQGVAVLNHIKEITELSTIQLKDIYSIESLGKYIIKSDIEAREHYQCGDKCDNFAFGKSQFLKGEITKNPPLSIKEFKTDSIYDWDKEDFAGKIELDIYQKSTQCPIEDCNDISTEFILSLYGLSKNLFINDMNNKIIFEKIFTLLMKDIKTSSYGNNFGIQNSANFFKVFTAYFSNLYFNNQYLKEYSPESLLYGNNKEDKDILNFLRNGNPFENYKPKLEKTTGFNLGNDTTIHIDSYTILTAQNDKTQILRRIVETNNVPFMSIRKMEYSYLKNSMIPIQASLYNFFPINTKEQWMSDGFQYDSSLDTLYYYDQLSCRILQFDYTQKKYVDEMHCHEYVLNKNISQGIMEEGDINQEAFGQSSQRFNKPYVISMPDATFTKKIEGNISKEPSFICVDPFSNMVIESSITLIYSMYTKNYMLLNEAIPKDEIIPMFLYERNYKMTQETYNEIFKGVISYFAWRIVLIVAGCGFIAGLLALGIYFTIKHCNEIPEINANIRENLLIPPDFA